MSKGPGGYNRDVKRESGASAFVQIAVVTGLVGAAVFGWWKVSSERERVAKLAIEAKEATAGDDAPALLKAKGLFAQIDPDESKLVADEAILASLAELEAQLFQAYGVQASRERAQRLVGLAKDRDVKKAERYAAEAYLLLGEGRANEAETMLMDIINNRGARHAKLLHALAIAKLQQGKAKEAVVAAQEGQKLSTQLVRLPIAEGDAFMAQGNFSGALNAYNKAKKLNPDHLRARTAITILAATSGKGKPALMLQELDRLLEESSGKAYGETPPPRVKGFIEYGKGEVFLVDNKATEALAAAEASLVTDPNQAESLALKGRALAKLAKVDDAKKAFDDALVAAPLSLPIAKAAALALRRAGAAKDGVAYLRKVVAANTENGIGHAELSIVLSSVGEAKEALKEAEEAIKIMGNAHDVAVFAKARAMQADGQGEKALEVYKEALGYHGNPEWAELYFALGEVRLADKNYDEASSAFLDAIKYWDKQGGSIDDKADAWENAGKAFLGAKKAKEAKEAQEKADALRKGETA
jgi:tetratricopeptide (TPR) repeat protein